MTTKRVTTITVETAEQYAGHWFDPCDYNELEVLEKLVGYIQDLGIKDTRKVAFEHSILERMGKKHGLDSISERVGWCLNDADDLLQYAMPEGYYFGNDASVGSVWLGRVGDEASEY